MVVAPAQPVKMSKVTRHYTFIDFATQGYMLAVAGLILLLHGGAAPLWPWLLLAHAILLALVHVLIVGHARHPSNRVLNFLRHFYPVLLYTGFYRETGELNQMTMTGYLDPFFIGLDGRIFGAQPSLALMQRLPFWPISELLYASYFSYYIMIVGVGLALFLRDRRKFYHYISVVSFVFYVCYLIYIFTPVMGPRIFHRTINGYELPAAVQPRINPEFPLAVQAGLFFRIMAWIYETFEAPGAAFPSSHVAVALTTVYFSFRYLRPIRFIHLVLALCLCLSTVYCRYHYGVDVAAGVITALLLVPLGNWFYLRFHKPLEEAVSAPSSAPASTIQSGRS
jgi:membrane-associated phospholipid phosphatase